MAMYILAYDLSTADNDRYEAIERAVDSLDQAASKILNTTFLFSHPDTAENLASVVFAPHFRSTDNMILAQIRPENSAGTNRELAWRIDRKMRRR